MECKWKGKGGGGKQSSSHFSEKMTFQIFNRAKIIHKPKIGSITLTLQKELGLLDFQFKSGSLLEIYGKTASFVILTIKHLQDFMILVPNFKKSLKSEPKGLET